MADPLSPGDVEHEDDRDRRDRELEERLERERHGPVKTHCSTCGKPLEAQLTCPACGDDDTCEYAGHDWADAGGGLLICVVCQAEKWADDDVERGGLGGEAAARLAERPGTWVKADLYPGLGVVFESSDTGERRREQDEAA